MLDVLRFWLDLGIDGFRLDAVPYLFEREGTNCENLPETHAYLKRVRAEVDARYPDRVLLAEANQWPADVVDYFGNGDECHMAFQFPVMPRLFMAIRREDARPIVEILEQTPAIPENAQWGLFLRNHDELTLEMVTDEERDYMYAEYAKDPRMRLNLGIRRRLAPLLDNGRDEIELLTAILFSLPGSPVLYYGDEIGMGDNIYLGDRDGVRTPMQWTGDRNAGFSRADFARLYLPPLMDPVYGYQAVNVEAQLRTPTSLLRWLHRFIALRKEHPVFALGTLRAAADGEPADPRARPPLRGRDRALRPQPLALAAAGRARPVRVFWVCTRGDALAHRVSRRSASCRTCSPSRAAGSTGSGSGARGMSGSAAGLGTRPRAPSCASSSRSQRWFGAKNREIAEHRGPRRVALARRTGPRSSTRWSRSATAAARTTSTSSARAAGIERRSARRPGRWVVEAIGDAGSSASCVPAARRRHDRRRRGAVEFSCLRRAPLDEPRRPERSAARCRAVELVGRRRRRLIVKALPPARGRREPRARAAAVPRPHAASRTCRSSAAGGATRAPR